MDWMSIATSVIPGIISIFGSGPWGLAGGLIGLAVAGGGIMYLISRANRLRDDSDLEHGGAHTGQVAVDLRNQANNNREFTEREREKFERGE